MEDIPQHYKQFYVAYRKIKKNILQMSKKHKRKLEKDMIQSAAKKVDKQGIELLPPFLFNDIIRQEIKKINRFAEKKYEEIIDNLMNMYKILKSMENKKYDFDRTSIEKQLDMIGSDIIHFDFYIRKNSKTIMKLGFYFDKVMNISINHWLMLSLIKERFCNINIDNLIVYLSFLYSLLRSLNETKQMVKKDNKWKPPDTFERTSTKFLIKYDDIVYTKVKIVKHLPYLIFDFSDQDLENHFKYFIKHRKYASFFDGKKDQGKKNTASSASKKTTITTNTNINKNIKESTITAASTTTGTAVGTITGTTVETTTNANVDTHTSTVKPFTESQQITSVYFDNHKASYYIKRILRYENAQLIRFRWYGDNDGNLDKTIFIERKVHHEEWTGEASTKERFELPQKYVMKYMTGALNIKEYFLKRMNKKKKEIEKQTMLVNTIEKMSSNKNEYDKKKQENIQSNDNNSALNTLREKTIKNIKLGSQIQRIILKEKLEPIIRTSYLRAAFQLNDNNLVRISIDTNISMLNEYVPRRQNWCRLAEEALGKNEVTRLNYGIIEVKLKVEKMPEWIDTILKTNNSINVYKYSKYQTAMAVLHSEKIKYIPIWIYNNVHEQFISSKNITGSLPGNKEENSLQIKGSLYLKTEKNWNTQWDKEKKRQEEREKQKQKKREKQKEKERQRQRKKQFALEMELCTIDDMHTSDDKIHTNKSLELKKFKCIPKMVSYANAKTENISNYNTLQKWNMLDKTYLWLNQKYNENNKSLKSETINLLKIDPKVNFAAERTFLHYALMSVYINLLALFLEKYKNKNRNLDFIIASLFLASFTSLFFSYFVYLNRIQIIQNRKTRESLNRRTRFDTVAGPVLFLGFMLVAIILSFYFNFKLKSKQIV